jgi:hypothetical protein
VVELVPGMVVVVADVEVEVGVEVLVDVLVEVDVELDVELLLVVVLAVVLVVVLEVVWQSCAASAATVLAPWSRLRRSVGLRVACRFATSLPKPATALLAAPHCPESTADETASSRLLRFEDSPPVSRFAPPPQATRKATANPRPPARSARGA